jgi:uncharacterized Tic20 family protein
MSSSDMNENNPQNPGNDAPGVTPPSSAGGPADPARSWNVACHLAALSGLFTGVGFVVGPLVVWLLRKADYPSVDRHGKESLNFQLSVLIYLFGLFVLSCFTCGMTAPLVLALVVAQVVLVVLASVKVSNGEEYRYPLTLRLLT